MTPLTRITLDPDVMGGKPCIRGLRVTVGTIVGLVASGRRPGAAGGDGPSPDDLPAGRGLAGEADPRRLPRRARGRRRRARQELHRGRADPRGGRRAPPAGPPHHPRDPARRPVAQVPRRPSARRRVGLLRGADRRPEPEPRRERDGPAVRPERLRPGRDRRGARLPEPRDAAGRRPPAAPRRLAAQAARPPDRDPGEQQPLGPVLPARLLHLQRCRVRGQRDPEPQDPLRRGDGDRSRGPLAGQAVRRPRRGRRPPDAALREEVLPPRHGDDRRRRGPDHLPEARADHGHLRPRCGAPGVLRRASPTRSTASISTSASTGWRRTPRRSDSPATPRPCTGPSTGPTMPTASRSSAR